MDAFLEKWVASLEWPEIVGFAALAAALWYVKQLVMRNKRRGIETATDVETVEGVVAEHETRVAVLEDALRRHEEGCEARHKVIDDKLDTMGLQLTSVIESLAEVSTKLEERTSK